MRHPLLVLSCALACAQPAPAPLQVLILSGHNNHEWRESTPFLRRILETTGRFTVRVTETPAALTAKTLAPYDVIVSDYCGPRWGEPAESAIENFVKSGKGLVVVHAASYPFGIREVLGERMTRTGKFELPWASWGEMVGATWSAQPQTGHGKRHVFDVKWTNPQHPIAQNMPPSFKTSDELYHLFAMKPTAQILATAFDAKEQNGTGKDEPLLWTVNYGSGRTFHTALGHDLMAMHSPGFIASFARGTEWAASGKVTVPPAISLNPKNKDAVNVLLVQGGHDYEASFDGIFEGWRDVRVNVDPHPKAYRPNIPKRYDVLVLYDSVDEVPPEQQKALQQYLESGKGLVVLHHSIVDFPAWEWWWKEVVGGLYVLNGKPNPPKSPSTYLHDVWQHVTPVKQHPVTKGLPPMWIFDETYKGLWISPEAEVLVTTDEKTSDGPLVWISPYKKARVVFIQLGHGREAHEHPWYRKLVHNAILWAAGRPNP